MKKKEKKPFEIVKQDERTQITTSVDDCNIKLNFPAKSEQGVLGDVKNIMINGTVKTV